MTGIAAGQGLFSFGAAHVFVACAIMLSLDIVQETTGSHTWLADSRRGWLKFSVGTALFGITLAAAVYRVYSNPPFIYFQF
jgi:hypothetical protein